MINGCRNKDKPKLDAEMMDLINKAADSRQDIGGREARNKCCDR
jgi:hypothetical protein